MAKPMVPWMGGKRRLVAKLFPLLREHTCYVEPFAGGAALFFAKEPSKCEVLNDISGDLVNLYRVAKNHLDEFVRQFRWALSSRQIFEWVNETPPETLTDIQRAARFLYLQKNCFSGKSVGRTFGTSATAPPKFNILRLEEDLSDAHLRLARTIIEHLPWRACVEKYDRPGTFFFCDPPYFGTAGYGVEFGLNEYEQLAELARSIKGHMLITVNDCREMRRAFKGLRQRSIQITYQVGGGTKKAPRRELIIQSSRP